jgi:protein-S-isoprenylcysteine O-methyltransferase Ste14
VTVAVSKAVVVLASAVMIAIRAPHGHRSRGVRVARSYRGRLEIALLAVAWLAFFLPLVWVVSGAPRIADYPLHPIPLVAGVALLASGLWLFYRAHADLGRHWSITLEVREGHRLVTDGVYRRIRHPMYLALLVYAVGQGLVLPNWIAGPSYAVAMLLLVALRLGPEERMMRAEFGEAYQAYAERTNRLIPGIW